MSIKFIGGIGGDNIILSSSDIKISASFDSLELGSFLIERSILSRASQWFNNSTTKSQFLRYIYRKR